MRCYDCGAKVTRAVRQFREPKDRRYKAGFRDVCEDCYEKTPPTMGVRVESKEPKP